MTEEELLEKIKLHKNSYDYEKARILVENYKSEKTASILRAYAESIYKDLELPKEYSYDKALEILENIKNDKNKSETLCLQGAIYKRKWEDEKNLDYLYLSIEKYTLSYEKYHTNEMYYGAINSSFLYDVLSSEFKEKDPTYSKGLQEEAEQIRESIIENYEKLSEDDLKERKDALWIKHSLAQAYLGTNNVKDCTQSLIDANKIKSDDWENYTSYKQLKLLAELKEIKDQSFLEPLSSNSEYISFDKKGLALSGGGFRASFFHLGTLAKLAECNVLKDIEVISTVSGGSIIGVLYYLKLQELLESKEDKEITQKDYIDLVTKLIDEFFDGVQKDIRTSVIKKKFFTNTIGKVLNPFHSYSRTEKLGEIYQEVFYDKYKKTMDELIITPQGWNEEKGKFKPRFNNWNRINKVPILVINSTNLNSGHTWQFQATKMGEPEYMTNMEIDKNNRFDWVRYSDNGLSKEFKKYPIGQAVASSSAVPLLFTPIYLNNLYEGYRLSISDGGVYDNQGFSGLLSEECDYIICSDASGQMDNKERLSKTLFTANTRIIDIQMDRNRELAFEEVNSLYKNKVLKGFIFTHLKKNIDSQIVSHTDDIYPKNNTEDFQQVLSEIRTDLDKFSKVEAYALMYNGYELLEKEYDCSLTQKENWQFLKTKINYKNDSKVLDELVLGKNKFFRKVRKLWMNS